MNRPILLKPKLIAELKKHSKLENIVNEQKRIYDSKETRANSAIKNLILNNEPNISIINTETDQNNNNNNLNHYKKVDYNSDIIIKRENHSNFRKINNNNINSNNNNGDNLK